SGVLLEILVAEDETAEVGARLAVVGGPTATPAVQTAPAVPSPAVGAPPGPAAASTGQPSAPRIPAPSPAAPASGGSRAEDAHQTAPVRKAVAEPEVAPAPPAAVTQTPRETPPEVSSLRGQTVRMSRIRKIIGDNMVKALHEQAQLTTVVEADVTRLMQLRARAKDAFAAREGFGLSPFPFFVRAAAQALKAHPAINARINEDEGTITYFDTENIGIAVDTEKGLMTPVIKGAGDLDVGGIARAIVELAGKARGGGLTPDDVTGATFTISNTGSRGALFDTVVVPPNQAAILGVGAMAKRPSVVETADGPVIAIRDLVHLSLSYDHRLIDGADAARYLTALKALVEAAAFTNDLLTE
ncbi:2-oxo acid dehydrogenase subunit E2, partial [Streptomyces chiangmaiensis]